MAGARARGWVALGIVVAVAGVVLAWRAGVFSPAASSGSGPQGAPAPATAAVTRQDLSATTPVTATLGYAGSYPVRGPGDGTLTWLPSPGQVIRQGQVLYQTGNGSPVVLLYGSVPAGGPWTRGSPARTCPSSTTTWWTSATPDSADIAALGWDYYSWETAYGVQQLEAAPGGLLPAGDRCRWGRWCSSRRRCGSAR